MTVEEPIARPPEEGAAQASRGQSAILLVDDRPENLVALEAVLQPLDARLVSVSSGKEALAAVLKEDFAVILLDVQMPGMDGFEAARYIRARDKSANVPIIFLTAISKDVENVLEGYGSGAIDYIIKPFDPFVLRSKVATFVELYEVNGELLKQAEIRAAHESLGVAQRAGESGIWDWDIVAGATYWSPEFAELYGLPPGVRPAFERWVDLVHPEDRRRIDQRLQQLLAEGTSWDEEFRIVHPQRGVRWLAAKGKLRRDADAKPVRFLGINVDITERKTVQETVRKSEERFRTIADGAPMIVFTAAADGGWTYANQTWLRLTGLGSVETLGYGWSAALDHSDRKRALARYRRVCASGKPLELTGPVRSADGETRWLLWQAEPQFSVDGSLSGYVGSAVDITVRKQAEERQALLAELSALLDEEVGLVQRLEIFVDFVVRRLDVACVIEVYRENGEVAHRQALTPSGLQEKRLDALPPQFVEATREAVASRNRVLVPMDGNGANGLGAGPAVTVPLVARGRALGAVIVVAAEGSPMFSTDDLALLESLASRAGIAIENARLYEREHEIATELQRAMLPAELPRPSGVRFQARYLTTAAELRVGGDWYDAFSLPDGRIACCVGDVVGTGIRAASAMGQLRSAVRALAATSAGPAAVLERLDAFAKFVEGGPMTTVVYAEIDTERQLVRYACAGHPPPLLVDRDGVRFLEGGRSAPLGCFGTTERVEAVEPLSNTAALVLYSDGIVERRGEPLDIGLDRLATAASELLVSDGGVAEGIDELVERMLEGVRQRDDVCVLYVYGLERSIFRRELRADPAELRPLRGALREWLEESGIDDDETYGILLATGEACANAIEHGQRLDGSSGITIELVLEADGQLTAVVRDEGAWRTPAQSRERGRGLPLIRASMDSVELDRSETGTTLRMQRKLRMRVVV